MSGWIKVHRRILNSVFYKSLLGKQRDVIITILLMADHEEKEWIYKGKKYKTLPGQVFSSLQGIANMCGKDCTRETVRTTITHAEQYGFLTKETHKTHTLITIENWETYQDIHTRETQNSPIINTNSPEGRPLTRRKKKEEILYSQNSDEFRLSNLLYELIKKNNPKFKQPNLNNWCGYVDKMLRIDRRSVADIETVIRWCQQDDFWHKNILSTDKLRKQFDKLYMNIPRSRNVISFAKTGGSDDGIEYF
ncbi:MAG: hypothetical protein E7A67_01075 [Peptostreptococcus anaerobius]|uniref:hypothetical protein n=1 Tax=Peptostreptococcus anaerobius TaxID=1261 RepID=UPI0028FE8D4C|nr:hypothetical protein [Peptostreptococcus anaerobius]MDU0963588.1 hypothetical protein [Peptostreptococcus anaerobius]MDU0997476.1 hypothetical protein [Peptostreptococcus anaerobius]